MGRRIANDWAKDYIAALRAGNCVRFRPVGGSMTGIIESGDLVEVAPPNGFGRGAVVLVQVGDFTYLHLVKDIRIGKDGKELLIGNNRGGINGWVPYSAVYGVLASVNDQPAAPGEGRE